MVDVRPRAWFWSWFLHSLIIIFAVTGAIFLPTGEKAPLRIALAPRHSVTVADESQFVPKALASSRIPRSPSLVPAETPVQKPAWASWNKGTVSESTKAPAFSMDDLLIPGTEPHAGDADPAKPDEHVGSVIWTSDGDSGSHPSEPSPPPPSIVPMEGAKWDLSFEVPAEGGFATGIDGNQTGHPEIDEWLSEYLRTITFPPSPDQKPYKTHWILVLKVGRPE